MDLIEERLIHHRHVEHLPVQSALERSEALSQMSGDFLSGNAELTAWSLLFYRYVRSDLGLQIKDLAQYLHIDSRQIRRHMQRGYYRLTEAIMHQEVAARATERHLWLLLKLPHTPPHSLINREAEQLALYNCLTQQDAPRLVVLAGPGGIGKTALATVVVHRLVDKMQLDDLAWVVLLKPIDYPDLIATLTECFGYADLGERTTEENEITLKMHLHLHPGLIIIDNAHFISEDNLIVERLVNLMPSGKILLVTRRHPDLRFPFQLITLDALGQPEFKQILLQEARRRRLSRTKHFNEKTIAEIHSRVGGNPLVGRLIVGQLSHLPRSRILENLSNLSSSSGESLFEELFAFQWDGLQLTTQRAALAIALQLPDSFTWSDVHDTVRLPNDQIDSAIHDLIRDSFLEVVNDNSSYSMPALTRRFLEEVSQHSPWRSIAKQIADATIQQSLNADSDDDDATPLTLLDDYAITGQPVEILISVVNKLASEVRRRGQWSAWKEKLSIILRQFQAENAPPEYLAMILKEMGITDHWLGYSDSAEELFMEAIEVYGGLGDFIHQAETLLEKARLAESVSKPAEALEQYQRASAIGLRYKDPTIRLRGILGLASLAISAGKLDEAGQLLEQAKEVQQQPDGLTYNLSGMADLNIGQSNQAISHFSQALSLFEEEGNLRKIARTQIWLGMAYQQKGDQDQALEHFQKGRGLASALGDVSGLALALTGMGAALRDSEMYGDALERWQEGLVAQEILDDQIGMTYTLYDIADTQSKLNQNAIARQTLARAEELATQLKVAPLLAAIRDHPLHQADD